MIGGPIQCSQTNSSSILRAGSYGSQIRGNWYQRNQYFRWQFGLNIFEFKVGAFRSFT